ncbi:hypothetical protein Trydic_g7926 [Trypoxylus dichotomus]
MHDLRDTTGGIAMDLVHICTAVKVNAHTGANELKNALKASDVVIMTASTPILPALTRESMFRENAFLIRNFAKAFAEVCPDALAIVVTNPLNSCVPIFCEVMKRANKLEPKKVFGFTTVDLVRANTFIAALKNLDSSKVFCPAVGGHSDVSIVPLPSLCEPFIDFTKEEIVNITNTVQQAGMAVVKARKGVSSTFATAYGCARFIFNLIRAKKGEANVVECSYTMNNAYGTKYFSSKLLLGKGGVEKDLGIGKVSDFEQDRINVAIQDIKQNVAVAEKFMQQIDS